MTDMLYRASDLLYLQWQSQAKLWDKTNNLRHIGIQTIANFDTLAVLRELCSENTAYGACSWDANTFAGTEILGTPNGRWVGYMLMSHVEDLGPLTISNVKAFTAGFSANGNWNLVFELKPYESSVPPAPRDLRDISPQVGNLLGNLEPLQISPSAIARNSTTSEHHLQNFIKRQKTPEQALCTGQQLLDRLKTQTGLTPSQFNNPAVMGPPEWKCFTSERDPPDGWSKLAARSPVDN